MFSITLLIIIGSFVTGLFQNIQEGKKALVLVLVDEQDISTHACLGKGGEVTTFHTHAYKDQSLETKFQKKS